MGVRYQEQQISLMDPPLSPSDSCVQDLDDSPRTVTKRPWTEQEDRLLVNVVEKYGPKQWSVIASFFEGRMGKQCRERWVQHLQPSVVKGNWTPEEDRLIMQAVQDMGTKWNQIAKILPGRGDNAIKNRYNSNMRKLERQRRQADLKRQSAGASDCKRDRDDDALSPSESPIGKRQRPDVNEQNTRILQLAAKVTNTEMGSRERSRLVAALMLTLQEEVTPNSGDEPSDTYESESEAQGLAPSSRRDDGSIRYGSDGNTGHLNADLCLVLQELGTGGLEAELQSSGLLAAEPMAADEHMDWKVSDFMSIDELT